MQNTMQAEVANSTEPPAASALIAVSCPRCGAVNLATAAFCHRCYTKLPKGDAYTRDHAAAGAEAFTILVRPPRRLTTGVLAAATVVLATLAILGYYVYDILSFVDIPMEKGLLPANATGGVNERFDPDDIATTGRGEAESNSPAAKPERRAVPLDTTAPTSAVVPNGAGSITAKPRRSSKGP